MTLTFPPVCLNMSVIARKIEASSEDNRDAPSPKYIVPTCIVFGVSIELVDKLLTGDVELTRAAAGGCSETTR